MSRGTYYAQRVIPCECGSREAYWHGTTLRWYGCDACWVKIKAQNPAFRDPVWRDA